MFKFHKLSLGNLRTAEKNMFRFQLFVFAYLFLSFAISSHLCEAGKGQGGRVEGGA